MTMGSGTWGGVGHVRAIMGAAILAACLSGAAQASVIGAPEHAARDLPVTLVAGAEQARYRLWLQRRARLNDARAMRALAYLDAEAAGQAADPADTQANAEMAAGFALATQGDFAAFVNRRAASDPGVAEVRLFLNEGVRPPGVDTATMWGRAHAEEMRFRDSRHRERDFVAWARIRAAAGDELAISVVGELDGEPSTLTTAEKAGLRRALLSEYTTRRNETTAAFIQARSDAAQVLRPILETARQRTLAIALPGMPVYEIPDEDLDRIDAALTAVEAARQATIEEFGDRAGSNMLAATATFTDEQGQLTRYQSTVDAYCGQFCISMLADDENADDILATNVNPNVDNDGTSTEQLVEYLRARLYNAQQIVFEGQTPAGAVPTDAQIAARRNLIADVIVASENPVFLAIENRDEFSELAGEIDEAEAERLEQLLGETRWERLKRAQRDGEYNHWIMLDDIRQIDGQATGEVLDPNADTYDAPLRDIARAANYAIVYVTGDRLEAPTGAPPAAPQPNIGEAVELDPPSDAGTNDAVELDPPSASDGG